MFDQFLRRIIQQRMNGVVLNPRKPPLPDHQTAAAPDTFKPVKVQPQAEALASRGSERVREIIARMTPEEKLAYIGGTDGFCLRAIPRPAWTSRAMDFRCHQRCAWGGCSGDHLSFSYRAGGGLE